MHCTINNLAVSALSEILSKKEAKNKHIRVILAHKEGNLGHYTLGLDTMKEHDVLVHTKEGIDILLDSREPLLDGIHIQYFTVPYKGFHIAKKKIA